MTNRTFPIHNWHTHSTRFAESCMSAQHQCEASTWRHDAHFATVVRGCCRGWGDWKRETLHRETITIVGTDIARLENAAPDQTVVLENGWIEHAER